MELALQNSLLHRCLHTSFLENSIFCRLARREKSVFEAVCCGRCGCGKLFLVTSLTKSPFDPHNPPPPSQKREEKNIFSFLLFISFQTHNFIFQNFSCFPFVLRLFPPFFLKYSDILPLKEQSRCNLCRFFLYFFISIKTTQGFFSSSPLFKKGALHQLTILLIMQ